MASSMTGFGRKDYEDSNYKISIEIKTVNHKYLNIYTKIPSRLNAIEDKIKKYINNTLKRGRIEVTIHLSEKNDDMLKLKPNYIVLDEYYKVLTDIKKRYKIGDDVNLELLSKFKDAIEFEHSDIDQDAIWLVLKVALDEVVESVVKMRDDEGLKLQNDIVNNLNNIEYTLGQLMEVSDEIVDTHRKLMRKRISEMLEHIEIDEGRIEQEIAIFADKVDINEEIIRIKSHLKQFDEIFKSNEPVGRKLDFLAQELNREINTIGSKSPDINISNYVISLKTDVGKIREQVLNIE